jgi:hypothetical protein
MVPFSLPSRSVAQIEPAAIASDTRSVDRYVVSGRLEEVGRRREPRLLALAAQLMQEDFEGTWPAAGWELLDASDTDGGDFLWGQRDCHPRSGSYAGWSIGGGGHGSLYGCSSDYPTNARTWAIYGPFDLSEATSASLTFHLWGSTEGGEQCPYDFLLVGSSIDGDLFSGNTYCGGWTGGDAGNGYYEQALDLSDRVGESQVWVGFLFASDDLINDTGFTVDDIQLTTDGSDEPTPEPTQDPPEPVEVTGITPNTGVNTGTVHIRDLSGSGFQMGADAFLANLAMDVITATQVTVVNSTTITCDFDLTDASPGDWHVLVNNPDDSFGMLSLGFTVTDPPPACQILLPLVVKRYPPVPGTPVLKPISNDDGDGNYTVTWTDADLIDTYTLQVASTSDFADAATAYEGSSRSYWANSQSPGSYYYRVRGNNSWGSGEWSNTESVIVAAPIMTLYPNNNDDTDFFLSEQQDVGNVWVSSSDGNGVREWDMSLDGDLAGEDYTYALYVSGPPDTRVACDVEILLRRNGSEVILARWTDAFVLTGETGFFYHTGSKQGVEPDARAGDTLVLRVRSDGSSFLVAHGESSWGEMYDSYIEVPGYVP